MPHSLCELVDHPVVMALNTLNPVNLLQETLRRDRVNDPSVGHCHISFRAGLLRKQEGKLKADTRKGQVALLESEDGFVSVQWCERVSADGNPDQFTLGDNIEVEQLVFQCEATMEWVNQSRRILKLSFPDVSILYLPSCTLCVAACCNVQATPPLYHPCEEACQHQ